MPPGLPALVAAPSSSPRRARTATRRPTSGYPTAGSKTSRGAGDMSDTIDFVAPAGQPMPGVANSQEPEYTYRIPITPRLVYSLLGPYISEKISEQVKALI